MLLFCCKFKTSISCSDAVSTHRNRALKYVSGGWKDKPQTGVTVSQRTGVQGLWGLRSPTWDGTPLQWRHGVLTSGPSGKSLQKTLKTEQ